MKIYGEKKKLKKLLGLRVCLTTNNWTLNQIINYMFLIGHWIDNDYDCNLHKIILNFYKGELIGQVIKKCLLE